MNEGILKISKEAHAYTPGLKVKRSLKVRRVRRLPVLGDVHVKVGEVVEFLTPIVDTKIPGVPYVVNAANELGVFPKSLGEYMMKDVGERVSEGEKIAGFTAFFGFMKKYVLSPIDGYIETVSTVSGQIILREDPVPLMVNAYISGKVVEVMEREGAVVETNAALVQGIFGIGGETHGRIKIIMDDPKTRLTTDLITPECKGKVLVGGSLVTKDFIEKAANIGAVGIVTGGIRDIDLEEILGYEIGVAITGHEDIGLKLIITEGFGMMAMNPRTLEIFKEFEGQMAAMNGSTQIRAGVIRPEVIIPHQLPAEKDSEDELAGGMKPGTPIRIIREPHFGALGTVINLHVDLKKVATESYVRVVEVKLESGERVMVPRANVEIIET